MSERAEKIRRILEETFSPEHLEIQDDSAGHAGHAGARQGGGHFFVTLVSRAFEGKSAVRRHQLVYAALGDMMREEIHALGLKVFTPEEFQ